MGVDMAVDLTLPEPGDLPALASHLAADTRDVMGLVERWRTPELVARWTADPEVSRTFAKGLLRAGHYVPAFEVACEGLANHPGDVALRYYSALALARARNPAKAWEVAKPLETVEIADANLAVDVLSLLGRIRKDLCELSRDTRQRRFHARMAAAAYERAFHVGKRSYPAVNTATMYQVGGDTARARDFARKAASLATKEALVDPGDCWLHATLGEARLLLGHQDPQTPYETAVRLAGDRYGDIASMRRNVLMLRRAGIELPAQLLDLLAIRTVVFSGHMIDHPERGAQGLAPRFPADPAVEHRVAQAITERLGALDARIGYASIACGSDILFCEAMLARGGELHVVLPFALDDFYTTSIDFGRRDFAAWRARADAVLARADEIHHATRERHSQADTLFAYCDRYMRGLALQRAATFATEAEAIVVLDHSSRVATGTTEFARAWRARGAPLHEIDLAGLREVAPVTKRAKPRTARLPRATRAPTAPVEQRHIHAMLFADVKNFSRLADTETQAFFEVFHAEIAHVLRSHKRTIFQNTWGDGLFMVCADVVKCSELAIGMLERFDELDWTKLGLPDDTALRIGLHVGPVYRIQDPVIRRTNFAGTHVNRAARIEPVTAPGSAYASEQFAAVLADTPNHPFVCDYVGVHHLAKEFDRCALYRLRT